MVFDPLRNIWRGNEKALEHFPRGQLGLIQASDTKHFKEYLSPENNGGMKWDPIKKKWIGNEKELDKFDEKKKGPGLIKHFSGPNTPQIVGNMKFDPDARKWVALDPVKEDDPFADIEDMKVENQEKFQVGNEFKITNSLREKFEQSLKAHQEMAGWFGRPQSLTPITSGKYLLS